MEYAKDTIGKSVMKKILQTTIIALLLAMFTGMAWAAQTVTYYHLDALGSPVAATNEQGNVIWKESYEPYGERIRNEAASSSNDIWYTGKQEDSRAGLSYFGARWYNPVAGRFMGIDPVGFEESNPQTFNRFSYTNNNPYRYVDPDGRWSTEAHNYFIENFAKDRGLNKAAVASIKSGSKEADGLRYQFGDSAHIHAMGDGINSSDTQRNKMNDFISAKFAKYQSLLSASKDANGRKARALRSEAYRQLGFALHAAMDSTSPAHKGFQVWKWNKETVFKHGSFDSSLESLDTAKSGNNNKITQKAMNKVMDGKRL